MVAAEEALDRLSLDGYQWMEDDDRQEMLERLLRRAGRDPDPVIRSNVETVSEDDFRSEIGAPPRPKEKTGG